MFHEHKCSPRPCNGVSISRSGLHSVTHLQKQCVANTIAQAMAAETTFESDQLNVCVCMSIPAVQVCVCVCLPVSTASGHADNAYRVTDRECVRVCVRTYE